MIMNFVTTWKHTYMYIYAIAGEWERKRANIYKIAFIKPVALNGLLPTEKTIKFCSSSDPVLLSFFITEVKKGFNCA